MCELICWRFPQALTNLCNFHAGHMISYFRTLEGELKPGSDDSGRQPLPSTQLEIILSFISARPFVFSDQFGELQFPVIFHNLCLHLSGTNYRTQRINSPICSKVVNVATTTTGLLSDDWEAKKNGSHHNQRCAVFPAGE